MKIQIKKRKGQSLTEFVLILPVFLLLVLGLLQLSMIFLKTIQLKYAAYMTARTAAAYGSAEEQKEYADRAAFVLETMMAAADNFNDDKMEVFKATILDMGKSYLAKEVQSAVFEETAGITMETVELENSDYDDPGFIKLMFAYDMPLKIPVVNRIFGLFQKDFRHKALELSGYPVYTIKTNALMRIQ
ncbi:MAG: TadE/TadG family type IV pilus assembly protein [Candidatus Goldiibacteriota bacterium]